VVHTPVIGSRSTLAMSVHPTYFDLATPLHVTGWRRGGVVSGVRRMNEVNARRARLVPGWLTVFGRVYHLGM